MLQLWVFSSDIEWRDMTISNSYPGQEGLTHGVLSLQLHSSTYGKKLVKRNRQLIYSDLLSKASDTLQSITMYPVGSPISRSG